MKNCLNTIIRRNIILIPFFVTSTNQGDQAERKANEGGLCTGTKGDRYIFNWIINRNRNIRFEMVPFDSENIDGMLYVLRIKRKRSCACNVTD